MKDVLIERYPKSERGNNRDTISEHLGRSTKRFDTDEDCGEIVLMVKTLRSEGWSGMILEVIGIDHQKAVSIRHY